MPFRKFFSLFLTLLGCFSWLFCLIGFFICVFSPSLPRWYHPREQVFLRKDAFGYFLENFHTHSSFWIRHGLDGAVLALCIAFVLLLFLFFWKKAFWWEKIYLFFSGALLFFSLDLFSKYWIFHHYRFQPPTPLLEGFLYLTYAENTGMAWSLLEGYTGFLSLVSFLAIFVVIHFVKVYWEKPLMLLALSLILGGALGNLYDRLYFGFVRDFIDLRFWPIFNFADTFIVLGAGCIVVSALFFEKEEKPSLEVAKEQ